MGENRLTRAIAKSILIFISAFFLKTPFQPAGQHADKLRWAKKVLVLINLGEVGLAGAGFEQLAHIYAGRKVRHFYKLQAGLMHDNR